MVFKASKNGGPFATRTKLGWVINGPLGRTTLKSPTANFIQAKNTLEQQFQEYCNPEFNNKMYDSKISTSQNDHRALDIMEQAVKLENVPPESSKQQSSCRTLKKRLTREPMVHKSIRKLWVIF